MDSHGVCAIELIEKYPCTTKRELLLRERWHIEQNRDICVNIKLPIILEDEQRKSCAEHSMRWYKNNRDKVVAKWESRVICECGANVCYSSKFNHVKTLKHFRNLEKKKKLCSDNDELSTEIMETTIIDITIKAYNDSEAL
jgi:hypothetical protein